MFNLEIRKIAAVVFLLSICTANVHADSTVVSIEANGQVCTQATAACAVALEVALPKQKPAPMSVNVGSVFVSGSTIETPAQTKLIVDTGHENKTTIGPNSKLRISSSDTGTSVSVILGKAWFSVKNKLNFFKVTDASGKFQGAVEGTEFSVDVDDGKIVFVPIEGKVELEKTVKLAFKDESVKLSEDLTASEFETLEAGGEPISYDLDSYENDPQYFENQADAARYYISQLQQDVLAEDWIEVANDYSVLGKLYLEQGVDEGAVISFTSAITTFRIYNSGTVDEQLAEDYTNLGYAYLSYNEAEDAFNQFERARVILEEIDPGNPEIAEAYYNSATAAIQGNQDDLATEYLSSALLILDFDTNINLELYQEFEAQENYEEAVYFGLLIAENYAKMAYIVATMGDDETAAEFNLLAAQLYCLFSDDQEGCDEVPALEQE